MRIGTSSCLMVAQESHRKFLQRLSPQHCCHRHIGIFPRGLTSCQKSYIGLYYEKAMHRNFGGFNPLNQTSSIGKNHMGKNPTRFLQKSFESNKPDVGGIQQFLSNLGTNLHIIQKILHKIFKHSGGHGPGQPLLAPSLPITTNFSCGNACTFEPISVPSCEHYFTTKSTRVEQKKFH